MGIIKPNQLLGYRDFWLWEKVVLTKLRLTWPYIFTLREFRVMWKVGMYRKVAKINARY